MKTVKNTIISSIINIPDQEVFRLNYPGDINGMLFRIRSLNLTDDLPKIYEWVNQPYAIPYWQMNGSYESLLATYDNLSTCPHGHSFVGYLDELMVCQLDVYDPFFDPVAHLYPTRPGDLGMHLLMAPAEKPIKGLSSVVLLHFLAFLFHSPLVGRLLAEPDEKNVPANQLLQKMKFSYKGRLLMVHKTANLYSLTKEQFKRFFTI